jgi:ATP-binding cassette subfamily C (CFTR/MRP) protein 1
MSLGYQKDLDLDDLWELKKADRAKTNSKKFQSIWQQELQSGHPSFIRALVKGYGWSFFSAAFFKLCQDSMAFLQPLFLKAMVKKKMNS